MGNLIVARTPSSRGKKPAIRGVFNSITLACDQTKLKPLECQGGRNLTDQVVGKAEACTSRHPIGIAVILSRLKRAWLGIDIMIVKLPWVADMRLLSLDDFRRPYSPTDDLKTVRANEFYR